MTENKLARVDDGGAMRAMSVPQSLDHMYEMVERAFQAKLVPTSFKDVESAFIAALKGAEFGLLPFQALAGFYVIGNIAHPYGTCVRGIVQASPLYEGDMDGCIEGVAELEYMAQEPNEYEKGSIDYALFHELQRHLKRRLARIKGNNNGKLPLYFCGYSVVKRQGQAPFCVLFDTNDAHKAGLLDKDMWKKWPTRMYMHRAATFARRDRFSAALVGLEATVEEIQDAIEVQAVEVPRAPAGTAPTGPMSTGQVLEHLATTGRPAPSTVREAAPAYAAPPPEQPKAPPQPAADPQPEAGYVPVGEPGAVESEDKAVPATPTASEDKAKAKGSAASVLKAAHERLKAAVPDKAQLEAILREARVAAQIPDYVARMSNATEEQKLAVAEAIDDALARLAADRAGETQPGTDPDDATNF